MSETNAFHAVVKGTVQGVSFRYFTLKKAVALELRGYVRNLPDGSVEVYAEGARQQLNALVDALQEGPRFASVDKLEVRWCPPEHTHSTFDITY